MKNLKNEKLTEVEVWDENIGWMDYDCPEDNTIECYTEYLLTLEYNPVYASFINADGENDLEKIRLNGKYIVKNPNLKK